MRYGEVTLNSTTPLRHAVNMMRRLKHLHERPVLLGAGIVTASGQLVKGDRTEEPMGRDAYRRIVGDLLARMKP